MLPSAGRGAADFNPRSPWGERQLDKDVYWRMMRFQSTLPVGGATIRSKHTLWNQLYFNPRSPWGERLSDLL